MHPDYEQDSMPWEGIGNEKRLIQLSVLSPVDLAVSKISPASDQDREDIRALGQHHLITATALRTRAEEALGHYVGNLNDVRTNIESICRDLASIEPGK
jgi:hypothetical protein